MDGVEVVGPDAEATLSIASAEVAVHPSTRNSKITYSEGAYATYCRGALLIASVFDDQPDVMLFGELDSGGNIGGANGTDRIGDEVT